MNYYVKRGETEAGPYTQEQINNWVSEGLLTDTDLGRTDGSSEWIPLPSLIPAIHGPGRPSASKSSDNQAIMIAAITGLFLLMIAGGAAGIIFLNKKDSEEGKPDPNANLTTSPVQAKANDQNQETSAIPSTSGEEPKEAFPLLPERELLPVSLAYFLPGKTIHYSQPNSDTQTWTEFKMDGSVAMADFTGQGKYTIENNQVAITLHINETTTSQFSFTFSKTPFESGDSFQFGADQEKVKIDKIESSITGSALLPDPQKVTITPPFDPIQLLMRAESGEAAAQALLARCHRIGWYLEKDEAKAMHWAQKAADQDHLSGKFTMAVLQLTADFIPRDEVAGNELMNSIMPELKAEAKKGNPWVQAMLAACYQQGFGLLKRDQDQYFELIKKSAAVDPWAQNAYANARREGRIGEKNQIESIKWHRKAATQGYAKSCVALGVAYMTNNGVDEDREEGARLFHFAAQRGGSYGAYCLSLALKQGHGFESPDPVLAQSWNKTAAERGWYHSINQHVRELTDGVRIPTSSQRPSANPEPAPENVIEAYMWAYIGFNRPSNNMRTTFNRRMTDLAKLMQPDQIIEAKDRAKKKFPNIDLRWELYSTSSLTRANALHEITNRQAATFEELKRISNLQTNSNPRIQAMAIVALEQIAPTNINRQLGTLMDERYQKRRAAEKPEPGVKDLNLLSRRYYETFLLAYLGDALALTRLQSQLLDSTNVATSVYAERLAKVLVLLPAGEENIAMANTIADRGITAGQQSRYLHWTHMTKALAQYRAKDYADSEKWADTVLNAQEDGRKHWGNIAPCWFFKAAALNQSGRGDEAKIAFQQGQKVLTEAWAEGGNAIYGYSHDYLLCKQLEREIGKFIGLKP